MPLHKNQIVPLSITAISSDGNGVGRHEGQVVFVPGAAVGDALRVQVVKAAKNHAYGRIQQVVTPGPGRIKSDCPVSASCGGCAFRHLSYEAELAAKQSFVADALSRIGHIEAPVSPILPSPAQARYRNKVQYPLAADKHGNLTYGFYASRSHRVVPCEDCLLQTTLMNQVAAHMARWLADKKVTPYDEAAHTGTARHLYLRQSHKTGRLLACLVARTPHIPAIETLAPGLMAAFPEIETVVLNLNPEATNVICGKNTTVLAGSGSIADEISGVPVRLDVHAFNQVNTAAAEGLFAVAREMAAPTGADTLLDLYCGTGVIGLSMAGACGRLIGVDTVPQAIDSARASAAAMGAANAAFNCESAAQAAQRLADEQTKVDIAVVDPPRKGMEPQALAALLEIAPKRLVMVSCNPATLARDLALLQAGGYEVRRVQPADLFPRTRHVECVVLLDK